MIMYTLVDKIGWVGTIALAVAIVYISVVALSWISDELWNPEWHE